MGSLDAAENSFSSLSRQMADLSPLHSGAPDVIHQIFDLLCYSMDVLADDACIAPFYDLINAVLLTEPTSPARSVLDRIKERLPYLSSIAKSHRDVSSVLSEKAVQGSSIIEEINQSISPYQRVSSLLREKDQINTRIAPLHAELDRCQVRLVEVEDQLGSFSVDDLVASARDQESRLALVRSLVQDIRARARENLVAHKVAEAEGREGNVE